MSEVMDQETATEATPTANSGLDVVVETTTYSVYRKPAKEGGVAGEPGFGVYKTGNALAKQIEAGEIEEVLRVDVTTPYAQTIAGIQELVTDPDEVVTIFNNGATSKVTTRLRSYFTEKNDAGEFVHVGETTFDASEFLSEPMKRKTLTDTQKAVKVLKGVSPEALHQALRAMGIISTIIFLGLMTLIERRGATEYSSPLFYLIKVDDCGALEEW